MTGNEKTETADIRTAIGIDSPASGLGRWLRRIAWAFAVLVVIVFALSGLHATQEETTTFRTQPAAVGDLQVIVSATGNLEPTNEVDIGIEVSGTVQTVEVDYNDIVTVGQVLARLDTTKLEAEVLRSRALLASAEASVDQVRATLNETRSELARLEHVHEMSDGLVPSQHEIDAARAAVQRAVANEAAALAAVAEAKATLEVDETDLSKAVVHAPINGLVLTRSIDPGQTVAASLQAPVLFTIAEDLTKMELHVDVDEADVGTVREGQQATFTVDAYPDQVFLAEITQVRFGAQEDEGVTSYVTVLRVSNSDMLLRPGMTATADIVVEGVYDALLVPAAALRFTPPMGPEEGGGLLKSLIPHPPRANRRKPSAPEEGSNTVWVLQDGRPTPVAVRIGASDGIMTEILEGDIMPGMELIVESVQEK